MSFLSTAVQSVMEHGAFCAVAATTPRGPHCTPLVFAYSGGRLWLTTSRGSVKARAWKVDPSVSGLVRHEGLSVPFTGTVKLYDALDRNTWGAAVAGATSIARATATFSRKNARFFAGYALDARQVPFAWTPPGRVFAGVELERTALLDEDGIQEGRGRWGGQAGSHESFRRRRKDAAGPLARLPGEVRAALGTGGAGVLTLGSAAGPVTLPVLWVVEDDAVYAALPAETLALADADPDAPAALTIDRTSAWRARDMVGAMMQGSASSYVVDRLASGAKSAATIASSILDGAEALIRLTPDRFVWWQGWSSGSVDLA